MTKFIEIISSRAFIEFLSTFGLVVLLVLYFVLIYNPKKNRAWQKTSKEEFNSSKPIDRLRKLQWWFILLIILGLLALALVWWSQSYKVMGFNPLAVSVAYAGEPTEGMTENFTPRAIIITGIFIILGIVYLTGIFKLFFSGNSNQVDTAADLVKTLTGFFVGAATGFLG